MKTKMTLMLLLSTSFISMNAMNCDTTIVDPIGNDSNDTTMVHPDNFIIQEELAEFPGGDTALHQYFTKSIEYPELARIEGITGKVIVSFIINEKGLPENITILRSVGGNCDEEIMRVINNMPAWKPAVQAGHIIRTKKILAFNFEL
jgi:protein TonB